MDIWRWLDRVRVDLNENGQERLAYLLRKMPNRCCDGDHQFVDNVYPEALALARAYGNPWVEVFVRHWNLQSQVLHRHRGKSNLAEAVSLLEFSSQESTRDCPQSICVVQDLANCYDTVDGPGYAEERIAVAQETLAKIDPTWLCWECISTEYISALVDAGRIDEERAARQKLREELYGSGDSVDDGRLRLGEARLEMRSGDLEAAYEIVKNARMNGASFVLKRDILKAEILALLGKTEEAAATLPRDDLSWVESAEFLNWAKAVAAIVESDEAANTKSERANILKKAELLKEAGAIRNSISVYDILFCLSLQARAFIVAEHALDEIDSLIPSLGKDVGAAGQQRDRRKRLEGGLAERSLAKLDRNAMIEALKTDNSPGVEELATAFEKYPSDVEIGLALAQALEDERLLVQSANVFRKVIALDRTIGKAWEGLGWCLLDSDDGDAFEREILNCDRSDLPDETLNHLDWIASKGLAARDPEAALRYREAMLERNGDRIQILSGAAILAHRLGHYDREVDYWTRCIVIDDDSNRHWDRMVAATFAEDWASVHDSAKALDMEISNQSGPIDELWEMIRVQIRNSDGLIESWYARRTGPVTAKIVEIVRPGENQRFGAEIIFDPAPLNKLDQEDEDGNWSDTDGFRTFQFEALKTSEVDPFVFTIDGPHPGQDCWLALADELQDLGAGVSRRSDDQYKIEIRDSGQTIDGLYVFVAVPPSVELEHISECLNRRLGSVENPMIWPSLLERIGDAVQLKKQAEIEELYTL